MSSNSDSIFNLLSYLKRHPKECFNLTANCANVVQIFVSDHVRVADADIYLPDNKLSVNRLDDDFVAQHGELLDYYAQFLKDDRQHFKEVWATTAHLTQKQSYFIELSYE